MISRTCSVLKVPEQFLHGSTGIPIHVLEEACTVLKRGDLVAFPTETVYGNQALICQDLGPTL